ncbi:hypothetical protein DE4585_02664 [Mycobacteroides salmoniphilum]|uniref:Uncharacterized protein n=1 Tax=Mycobacteroides salmoniphilum TaxID=404941 RepID=A0A4V3HYC0_9MYCO|nr:hypothetical protein DE4585_02664 [Mycobacteroides salmoniphilum]
MGSVGCAAVVVAVMLVEGCTHDGIESAPVPGSGSASSLVSSPAATSLVTIAAKSTVSDRVKETRKLRRWAQKCSQ